MTLEKLISDISGMNPMDMQDRIDWMKEKYRAADKDLMAPIHYMELLGGLIHRYCVVYKRATGVNYCGKERNECETECLELKKKN